MNNQRPPRHDKRKRIQVIFTLGLTLVAVNLGIVILSVIR